MALKPCAECNELISNTATKCPKCGSDHPHGIGRKVAEEAGQRLAPIIGVILGVVILFLFLTRGCQ